jgi:hypothetical protein
VNTIVAPLLKVFPFEKVAVKSTVKVPEIISSVAFEIKRSVDPKSRFVSKLFWFGPLN